MIDANISRIDWHDCIVPINFRETIEFLISKNVFWRCRLPNLRCFTIGHFATKINDCFYSSYRYDMPENIMTAGLMIVGKHDMDVAHQSVIHFHCPKKNEDDSDSIEFDGIVSHFFADHGPNIHFNNDISSAKLISFIENNFDLTTRTKAI